jgi:hypothetical protein
MFPLNTILAWNINIIMNKKYDNNNIIIASRAYFLHLRRANCWVLDAVTWIFEFSPPTEGCCDGMAICWATWPLLC